MKWPASPVSDSESHSWRHKAWAWSGRSLHQLKAGIGHIPKPIAWAMAAIGLIFVAIIVFLAQPNWNWFRPTLASIISNQLHRPVRIDGPLRVYLFRLSPATTVSGLKISEPNWARSVTQRSNLAEIDQLAIDAELIPLLTGKLVLKRLQLEHPDVALFQDKEGRANWDFRNGASKGKPTKLPLIKNFIINDGKLTLKSLQRRLTFTGTINAHEKALSGRQAFGLTGAGSLNDNEFQLSATGGPLLNVRTHVPYPFDMTIKAGNTQIIAKGRVLRPFDLGQLEGTLKLSGRNLADLYYITGLTLPNTPAYNITANVKRDEQQYNIDAINGRIGSSDLQGTMKVDTHNKGRPYLTGDLHSRSLDFEDLGAIFGASRANAPRPPELKLDPEATRSTRHLLPNASLDVQRVRGMDAKVRYRALAVKATPNLPLRQVSLGINLDHGLLKLDPIDLSFPQGRLQGMARIDARSEVQTNAVDMTLTGLRVQDFVRKIGGSAPVEGVLNARVKATGTGNSVHKAASTAQGELTLVMPGGTIRQSLAELMGVNATKGLFLYLTKNPHQTEVRCAIAHFGITNGVTQAQNIVFDTEVVRVHGSGKINLKDESMKLAFRGKPKKFRLIKINAPLVIGGHLSAPTFGVDPGPAIAQGGLALAFNSVLPLLGLNQAKDANCGELMSEARNEGAATTTRTPPRKAIADPIPGPVVKN